MTIPNIPSRQWIRRLSIASSMIYSVSCFVRLIESQTILEQRIATIACILCSWWFCSSLAMKVD